MSVLENKASSSLALTAVFEPRGVAVVGASRDATKRGYQAVRALLDGGYTGGIYPVHPAGGELCGLRVWPSIEAIEGTPDLALICTPASTVAGLIESCGRRGVHAAVVLAVGFGEATGSGPLLERALEAAIERSGVRVVGPNTSGVMNLGSGLNLIGTRGIRAGRIALLVQSGNMALGAMTEAMATSAEGLSVVVGVGNETDLRYHEYLAWLGEHVTTGCVLMYAEGFRDVRAFLATARAVVTQKPVVLLKGGRSDAGRAAARSHTGALAGEYTLLRAALRQVGVIEVQRSDELFPVGFTLLTQPLPRAGTGVAILSDGGGHGTLAADALTEQRTRLVDLSTATQMQLRELLGGAAAVTNPIDLAGAADRSPAVFADALQVLLRDDDVGSILVVGLFGGYGIRFAAELTVLEAEAAVRLAASARAAGRSLVVHTLYAAHSTEPLARLRDAGVPVVGSLDIACRCIAAAHERAAYLTQAADRAATPPRAAAIGTVETARFAHARAQSRDTLLETEVRELVAAYGVPTVDGVFCATEAEVAAHAALAARPLALKLVSGTISHKARAGGVVLDVLGADTAVAAYRRIVQAAQAYAARHNVSADIRGVLVTPMLELPLCELIVGVRSDVEYGPLVLVGGGGTAVELLRDSVARLLPIDAHDVRDMLTQTRAGALLRNGAGLDACVRVVLAVADCFLQHGALAELELNPVFAYDDRVVAVDARAFLTPPTATIP